MSQDIKKIMDEKIGFLSGKRQYWGLDSCRHHIYSECETDPETNSLILKREYKGIVMPEYTYNRLIETGHRFTS